MRPHREFRVLGEGGVTVLDGRKVTYTNIAEAESGSTMSVFGVTLHLLGSGDVFDLRRREPRDLPGASEEDEEPRRTRNGRTNGKRRSTNNGNGSRNGHGRRNGTSKSR
jgi:hypothetical protein